MVDMEVKTNTNVRPVRNGSFRVNIPIARNYETEKTNGIVSIFPKYYEQVDSANYTVQMLTQNDYAEGWQQIVPNAKYFTKRFIDTEGNQVSRLYSNAFRMKVNLAQLPEHLWHKMQYVDQSMHTVNNGYHYYYVESSNVDDEIRELAHILRQVVCSSHRNRVHELLHVLKDNDVYGWVVIKGKNMYH
jgi:hypothetical protein